ncbi:tyrosine-protein phosphatase [Microbacterium terricola]|uniref:Phosphatase n=1 Tax=Microbacterium terricola TaxID=344163 RepID=A0ABM8E162_9MICO|nr:tyrosine-protein phosphatase [Microbacterium terricola]UYK40588.1 tyrosine-protein phosphatase [Microbacterium terricola]BDV31684.1 phosphatase [Microbacterium terricola]
MLEGTHNFRDTGGMPLTGGGATRPGVLFRSDALGALTPAGLAALADTPIGVVVDFRTPAERAMAPDLLPDGRPFQVVELSILEGAMSGMAQDLMRSGATDPALLAQAMAHLPTLGELYVGMLQHGATAFAEVARLIAASTDDAPTAVLVHCTAGKDRTGVATALMLEAVGADRAAVVADYAASETNLAGPWADAMLATVERMGAPLTPGLRELVTGTPAAAIAHALAWIDAEHGGAEGYLRSGGLTDAELAALRARLAA